MMLTAAAGRRHDNEMLDLMQMAKPFHERHGNAAFQMSMRECRERWNSVGGQLSGLWTKYYEPSREEFEEQFESAKAASFFPNALRCSWSCASQIGRAHV